MEDLLTGRDNRPISLSIFIAQCDCSRTVAEFAENKLQNCEALAICWIDKAGNVNITASKKMKYRESKRLLREYLFKGGGK